MYWRALLQKDDLNPVPSLSCIIRHGRAALIFESFENILIGSKCGPFTGRSLLRCLLIHDQSKHLFHLKPSLICFPCVWFRSAAAGVHQGFLLPVSRRGLLTAAPPSWSRYQSSKPFGRTTRMCVCVFTWKGSIKVLTLFSLTYPVLDNRVFIFYSM